MVLKQEIQKQLDEANKKIEMMEKVITNYHLAFLAVNEKVIEDLGNDDYPFPQQYCDEFDLIYDSLNKKNHKIADESIKKIIEKDSYTCEEVYNHAK